MKKIIILYSAVVASTLYGAEVSQEHFEQAQEFVDAARKGDYEKVKTLLEEGVDVNIHDDKNDTALIVASVFGHGKIVDLLLKHGAVVDTQDYDGHTGLILAAANGYRDIVALLLMAGADTSLQNMYDETALIIAQLQARDAATIELIEQANKLDDLIASKQFNTVAKAELLRLINSSKNDDSLFQLLLQRTIALLRKYETNTNSTEYRNAARILYTFARRIAQDYIKVLGTKTSLSHGIKVLLHELETPIFIASYHPTLVGLHIANAGGQDESFVHVVEENIDRLMPK